jgi:hypothetical protein
MKNIKVFEQFINEGVVFGKKGIAAKIKASLEYAKEQLADGQKWYEKIIVGLEKMNPNSLDYDKHPRQFSPKRDDFEVFMPRSARDLAVEIGKVIKKYKGAEVAKSSTPAAAGWSGTMRSTVSGDIQPRVNFHNGSTSYIIAVTIGSGIDRSTKDKIMQELYELFFVFEEWNSSDGGIAFEVDYGTNYSTIGLSNRKLGFNNAFAKTLMDKMNG